MKKYLSIVLALVFLSGIAAAETIYVTISDDQGNLVMASEAVNVNDMDGDGVVNFHEALIAAHDLVYPGGSEAGYAATDQGYGLSMSRLWGVENGGSYGYYVNNVSAFSLLDPLSDGDCIYAYAFTDLETWSDTFSFFELDEIKTDGSFKLSLSAQTYDADWNPVFVPVEGAVITVNGEDTELKTDAEGKVTIALDAGEYLISARSETMTLVPPVYKATVSSAK